mmetsp:Transcript_20735/g.45085  ORF Transcript_20735/g.45085 Transcript_20735/m.45085 type:complete len:105 (-) Transcript_20735:386-700(-)
MVPMLTTPSRRPRVRAAALSRVHTLFLFSLARAYSPSSSFGRSNSSISCLAVAEALVSSRTPRAALQPFGVFTSGVSSEPLPPPPPRHGRGADDAASASAFSAS